MREELVGIIIKNYREELRKCETPDQVNKIYRQARIWSRFHYELGNSGTPEEHAAVNTTFKKMKWNRLNKLEEKSNGKEN